MRSQSSEMDFWQLQLGQMRHDELAHQDIWRLSVPRRLSHFTLHFAKYVGGLALASRTKDVELKKKIITDSLVIALASANTMRIDLGAQLSGSNSCPATDSSEFDSLVLMFAEIVGQMAKACEAYDHAEKYPSREVMERGVVQLIPIIEQMADHEQLDLQRCVHERWRSVEKNCRHFLEGWSQVPPVQVAA